MQFKEDVFGSEAIDPYLPPREEEDPYLVMLAEAEAEDAAELAEMPPPMSTSAHKRKAETQPGRSAKLPRVEVGSMNLFNLI